MHFRLIYPQKHGVKPVWPYLNEARRTVWPEGDEALMRPIYTVRTIDREARSFDFDIFMHEGGPTANWAQRVEEGCEIGLLGPAGGWMPKADHMLMAGDETAHSGHRSYSRTSACNDNRACASQS
ncbi:siderophore-interacting protein [uncultured Cohaesibacter sp.]|uniref:siderophore-interacting protein n=1 Tax=uncultured Cohaesibacter sp. TaxID=1002546 RepID=UPI0029C6AC4F|nr:siderophore-interacting protein [uncultured Cohaesibacter sp.]